MSWILLLRHSLFWRSAKKYWQYSWQLALSWRQNTRRDREIESLDISAKSTNRVNAILAALLLLLQKKENAILLHTLRVIKPTRGVLKRIVIHKIRILCGLLLLMHLFAFLFNKIAHLGTMRYVSCVYLGIYYTSMYLTFFPMIIRVYKWVMLSKQNKFLPWKLFEMI